MFLSKNSSFNKFENVWEVPQFIHTSENAKKEENSSKKNKSKRTLDKNNEVGQNFLASASADVELAIADISNMENREPGPGVQPIENGIDRPKPKSKRVYFQNPVYGDQKAH